MLQSVRRLAIIFLTQYLLYGVYAVLFGICMQVLSKRSAGRYRMLSLSMILLFGFATVSLIIATLIILGETDLALAKSMQTIELDLGLEPSIAESSWGLR
ncbi:hypothetical protein MPER_03625 [Moniliophthora perniciosa FA553]|nr:hypothetical protein MPER_03625 [Moniliophthora perniciosa FA553]